jgi:hypothetical protein
MFGSVGAAARGRRAAGFEVALGPASGIPVIILRRATAARARARAMNLAGGVYDRTTATLGGARIALLIGHGSVAAAMARDVRA